MQQCLKITEKVEFSIASEASCVNILSGQKFIENAKNGPFRRVSENLKLAVKQCYQTGQFKYVCRTKIGKKSQNNVLLVSHFRILCKSCVYSTCFRLSSRNPVFSSVTMKATISQSLRRRKKITKTGFLRATTTQMILVNLMKCF